MAQIIPSITSLPVDSSAAPSVEDIQDRLPSICVDYLSHDWSEEDVWASWRNMTRHKHEIANGVRLENASWRTWQKQRNKLKTISPETLNWLKDSDVTWLYGPLHTANVEPVRPLKVSSTDDRLGIDRVAYKKPILKHRTLSEMLTIPMPCSPILEATSRDDELDGVDVDSERPILLQSRSDTNIVTSRTTPVTRQINPFQDAPPVSKPTSPAPPPVPSPGSAAESHSAAASKKHISFNTFVEQCVALDEPRDTAALDSSDDDDEMLEMRSSSYSSSSRSSRPSLSRNSSTSSEHMTIAMIAPTMLKTSNVPGGTSLQYAPPAEYQSPTASQSSGFDFPSPHVDVHTGKWADHDEDEDEYGSVGFDYFGGPNLGAANEENGGQTKSQPVPAHVGSSSYGRNAPTVNQPPAQPKWRQPSAAATTTTTVEPSSASSNNSSSSSLNNAMSPPQPSRSILKVRPTNPQPVAPEPSSPPTAYFNYNPSAATGIGGLRGSVSSADQPGPTGSPLVSPVAAASEERGRGRSASRDRTLNDRSTSRGTSASSTSSLGSASVRSPNEGYSSVPASSNSSPAQPTRKAHSTSASGSASSLDKVQEGVSWEPSTSAGSVNGGRSNSSGPDYVPDRSNTPTPHSSPQISFRPLKDTSPASLPHSSTTARPFDLPNADPATTVSPNAPSKSSTSSGGRATIAHVGTNAQPTLSQPVDDEDGASIMGRAANIASTAKDLLGALWYGHEGGTATSTTSSSSSQGQGLGSRQGVQGGVNSGGGLGRSGSAGRGHKRGASLG